LLSPRRRLLLQPAHADNRKAWNPTMLRILHFLYPFTVFHRDK